MRILLDECVPGPCTRFYAATPVPLLKDKDRVALRTGELLQLAEGEFDLFITSDQNIRYQQNLTGR